MTSPPSPQESPPATPWSAPEGGPDPWGGASPPGWGDAPAAQAPPPGPATPGGPGPGRVPAREAAPGWAQISGAPPTVEGAVVVRRGIVPIKPLGLGDLLEGSFQALRHNPRVMILVTMGVLILTALVGLVPLVAGIAAATPFLDADEPTTTEVASGVTALVTGSLGTLLLAGAGASMTTGLLSVSVGQSVVGRRIGLGENWRRVRGRVLPLIGLSLLITVMVGAGPAVALGITAAAVALGGPVGGAVTGLVLVPASFVLVAWLHFSTIYAPVALVLERAGVLTALRRSFALVKRNFWRTLGVWLLAYVIVNIVVTVMSSVLSFGYLLVFALAPDNTVVIIAFTVLVYVGQALLYGATYPYLAAIVSLLYVDRRIRIEGLDIALNRAAADPVTSG